MGNFYNPSDYIVERIDAPADDGALVPVTLLRHRTTPIDGTAPASTACSSPTRASSSALTGGRTSVAVSTRPQRCVCTRGSMIVAGMAWSSVLAHQLGEPAPHRAGLARRA